MDLEHFFVNFSEVNFHFGMNLMTGNLDFGSENGICGKWKHSKCQSSGIFWRIWAGFPGLKVFSAPAFQLSIVPSSSEVLCRSLRSLREKEMLVCFKWKEQKTILFNTVIWSRKKIAQLARNAPAAYFVLYTDGRIVAHWPSTCFACIKSLDQSRAPPL